MRRNKSGGDALRIREQTRVGVIRANGDIDIPGLPTREDGFTPFGWFNIQVFDSRGIEKFATQMENLVLTIGKIDMLNTYFCSGTQILLGSWYMGLITSSGFTGIAATDTSASHPGWSEFTSYSGGARPAWGQVSPVGSGVSTISNSSPVTFNITGSATLNGGFIISNSTIGGTTGILWAAALFSAGVPVNNGDQMKVTYSLSC
jgi:hypothetical protein